MRELTRIREGREISRERLAALAGLNKATVHRIERGMTSPTVETLEKLAAALECEVADFFPKAQAPLPFEEYAGPVHSLEPDLWRKHALRMADFYESLVSRDAPIEKVEGWADVIWNQATDILAIVESIDDLVDDEWIVDEEGEMIPLLQATFRMACQAKRVITRAERGSDRDVEAKFWKIVEQLKLTDEQREEILA